MNLSFETAVKPPLDPGFQPAALWTAAYRRLCDSEPGSEPFVVGIGRPDGSVYVHRTRVLPAGSPARSLTFKHIERIVKTMLWARGGSTIFAGGRADIGAFIRGEYSAGGQRGFDRDFLGAGSFLSDMRVVCCGAGEVPAERFSPVRIGRSLSGRRIGFDIGGSDRKVAAVLDGRVVFSEEVPWSPYFQKDPEYHYAGINASVGSAAAHLPGLDSIGGSAAGIYIDNEPRIGSLFRGVPRDVFDRGVRPMFRRLSREWNGVPVTVVNDGEVSALAGAMWLKSGSVLGLSMGTSQAGGYCDAAGHITEWLNELAFVPVDYREDAPADEWSGDRGCGVQYFSQQAVARLLPAAGIVMPGEAPPAEKLVGVQNLMAAGDPRARRVYETIGVYLGYSIGWYAGFYEFGNLLLLGRVLSGEGGRVIAETAERVLELEFPSLREKVAIRIPDEKFKRHGQAIAAASLIAVENGRAGS